MSLQSDSLKVEATEADEFDEERYNAMEARIDRRIRDRIEGEFRVIMCCLPHLNLSVLDEVALEGKIRFENDPWWDAEKYVGEVKDGIPHGFGVKTWKDGDRYEG